MHPPFRQKLIMIYGAPEQQLDTEAYSTSQLLLLQSKTADIPEGLGVARWFIIMSKTAASSSAKNAGAAGKQPKNASGGRGAAPSSNSAFKWQLGGLIAGIVVALVSTTAPGQQVSY